MVKLQRCVGALAHKAPCRLLIFKGVELVVIVMAFIVINFLVMCL